MDRQTYLVVEPVAIIATDLALSIQDYNPDAVVLVAATPAEALEVIRNHAVVHFAFVHSDPAQFLDTPLARALAALGTQPIFMGEAAERPGVAVWVLQRPFSTETTSELLGMLNRQAKA